MFALDDALAPELAARASAAGLTVTLPDGSTRPIPTTTTATLRSAAELKHAAHVSRDIASAIVRLANAALAGRVPDVVRPALSPLERHFAERVPVEALAVSRVDYFDGDGLRALELNATIPAMQHYGDVATTCWRSLYGPTAPAATPSNTAALIRVLTEAGRSRLGHAPERVAILARRNDAQLGELNGIAAAWRERGPAVRIVYPDQLHHGEGGWTADGWAFDFVYRHLFVRRLEGDAAPEAIALLSDPKVALFNPPASQFEVKAVLALLSEAEHDGDLATVAQIDADVLSVIPWTRRLMAGRSLGPDGREVDVLDHVARDPDRFVLKRSWDYGGRAVFVGSGRQGSGFGTRVLAAFGRPMTWAELVGACASDPRGGGFIVQERVEPRVESHRLATAEGVIPAELFVDLSHYASVGLPDPGWGAVVRGSTDDVVNIVGGGGVIPLLMGA